MCTSRGVHLMGLYLTRPAPRGPAPHGRASHGPAPHRVCTSWACISWAYTSLGVHVTRPASHGGLHLMGLHLTGPAPHGPASHRRVSHGRAPHWACTSWAWCVLRLSGFSVWGFGKKSLYPTVVLVFPAWGLESLLRTNVSASHLNGNGIHAADS